MEFSYLCLLLFMIIFILYVIKRNLESSPKKIKRFMIISLVLFLIKYMALLVNVVIEKQRIIYMFKYCTILNYISLPLLVIIALYVFLRDEKLKFDTNYIFIIPLLLFYLLTILSYKFSIHIDNTFGFIINIENGTVPILIYLIMIASLTVFNLLQIDKPYSNKCGMRVLLFSLIACIVEYILFIGGMKLYPYPLISEALVLFTGLKAINTFKN